MNPNIQDRTILSDFLSQLNVPHTDGYTDRRFASMPFMTLFGLSKLLEEYNIPGRGLLLEDKSELIKLTPPFLAHTKGGFAIVTALTPDKVTYMSQGETENISTEEFEKAWDGNVYLAFPTQESKEPGYGEHRRFEILSKAKNIVLYVVAILLFLYLFISNGIYSRISTVLLTLFDMAGLYLTYLLVQKSMKIKNKTADRVCGILEEGGCDSILELKSAKFFGLFSWSEVGFSYFSVSLLTLLIFPEWIRYLAACNVCCLPFTCWSIWYQKFRAKRWCTLCVSVQTTLWCLFFCYLGGGWLKGIFPLRIEFFVLGLTYLFVLLALNRVLPNFGQKNENADAQGSSADDASGADAIRKTA